MTLLLVESQRCHRAMICNGDEAIADRPRTSQYTIHEYRTHRLQMFTPVRTQLTAPPCMYARKHRWECRDAVRIAAYSYKYQNGTLIYGRAYCLTRPLGTLFVLVPGIYDATLADIVYEVPGIYKHDAVCTYGLHPSCSQKNGENKQENLNKG